MQVIYNQATLAKKLKHQKKIILIPTMGGLHQGHLALVNRARQLGGTIVVSIYVNPLQFGADEDFDQYPRDLKQDCRLLNGLVDVVYAPSDYQMYPQKQTVGISLPPIADELCGSSRPGFFQGVCTVVSKLFNQVQPHVALFGQKDYQQIFLVRLMVAQLNWPIAIESVTTCRDYDGLALSSRNRYLSPKQRKKAPILHQTLIQTARLVTNDNQPWNLLCENAQEKLNQAGMICDYFTLRSTKTLDIPKKGDSLVILAAAWLGQARLIDNLEIPK